MAKTKTPEPTPKSRRLEIEARPGVSEDRLATDLVAQGEATNASTALRFVNAEHGELSLTDMVASLREQGEAVNRGNLAVAERMLNAQAVALNAMFAELARRGAANMGTHLPATETYLRLALKAQAQSRATVETLAALKNPPVVFARQANIAHGPQQVNNGQAPAAAAQVDATAPRAKQTVNEQTELLGVNDGERVDFRAPRAAGAANPHLAPVGGLDGA